MFPSTPSLNLPNTPPEPSKSILNPFPNPLFKDEDAKVEYPVLDPETAALYGTWVWSDSSEPFWKWLTSRNVQETLKETSATLVSNPKTNSVEVPSAASDNDPWLHSLSVAWASSFTGVTVDDAMSIIRGYIDEWAIQREVLSFNDYVSLRKSEELSKRASEAIPSLVPTLSSTPKTNSVEVPSAASKWIPEDPAPFTAPEAQPEIKQSVYVVTYGVWVSNQWSDDATWESSLVHVYSQVEFDALPGRTEFAKMASARVNLTECSKSPLYKGYTGCITINKVEVGKTYSLKDKRI
jgi:hypothetical protein